MSPVAQCKRRSCSLHLPTRATLNPQQSQIQVICPRLSTSGTQKTNPTSQPRNPDSTLSKSGFHLYPQLDSWCHHVILTSKPTPPAFAQQPAVSRDFEPCENRGDRPHTQRRPIPTATLESATGPLPPTAHNLLFPSQPTPAPCNTPLSALPQTTPMLSFFPSPQHCQHQPCPYRREPPAHPVP